MEISWKISGHSLGRIWWQWRQCKSKHISALAGTVLGGYDSSDDNANPNTFQHWRAQFWSGYDGTDANANPNTFQHCLAEFVINIGEIGKNNGIMQRQSLVLSAAAIFISVLAYGMAIRIALLSTALYAMRYSRYTITHYYLDICFVMFCEWLLQWERNIESFVKVLNECGIRIGYNQHRMFCICVTGTILWFLNIYKSRTQFRNSMHT